VRLIRMNLLRIERDSDLRWGSDGLLMVNSL